jgi:aromatic ring-opening dioxygenase LigB subunit
MPHPPIIVPEVGRGRERDASATVGGIDKIMKRLGKMGKPDRILLASPHQPYISGCLAINKTGFLKGSFASFGAPSITFDLRTDLDSADSLRGFLSAAGVPVSFSESADMTRDQGSTVPLYFLKKAYGELPHVVLVSPIGLDAASAHGLGQALARFDDGCSWGFIASGDLSHRLKPGAPAGFSPDGGRFDLAVVESVGKCDASIILNLPERVVEDAGECGMRSALALVGLVSSLGGKIDVLSYEGPFGVGYCNALWIKE